MARDQSKCARRKERGRGSKRMCKEWAFETLAKNTKKGKSVRVEVDLLQTGKWLESIKKNYDGKNLQIGG